MDYPCAKFGGFSFSRFDFIVWTDRQNHTQRRMIAILTRIPSALVVTDECPLNFCNICKTALIYYYCSLDV